MGVWIEIPKAERRIQEILSLPLWECGLKFCIDGHVVTVLEVSPLVGVWIEIDQSVISTFALDGHSPCGSVD